MSIPDSVVQIGESCFYGYRNLQSVTFGESSRLERIGASAFYQTNVESLSIPDSVVEIGERCFDGCQSLQFVTFGESSKIKRIGHSAFKGTNVQKGDLPKRVRQKCSSHAKRCTVA